MKILPLSDNGALLWAFDSLPAVTLLLAGAVGEGEAETRSRAVRSVEILFMMMTIMIEK